MDVKRISMHIRLACLTLAVLLPLDLSAQNPRTATRPFRRTQPAVTTTQPFQSPRPIAPHGGAAPTTAPSAALPLRPGLPTPPRQHAAGAPRLEDLEKLVARRNRPTPAATTPAPTVTVAPAQPSSLPTTLPAGERGIQFSFNNLPISAVLDFFERITGLPILGDRNIQGTLSYFNRKLMTTDEAVEELNLLLSSKGVVLIRVDDHEVIGKFPDVLRNVGQSFTSAEQFKAAGVAPNEVVRVFFKVNALQADELNNMLADTLPLNEVKLMAWPTTGQIQIVALASQVRRVISLAEKLDREFRTGETGGTYKIFKPRFMQPSALERIIKAIAPTGGNVTGPGNYQLGNVGAREASNVVRSTGGDKSFQIVSDDSTGILIVKGNPGTIDQVGKLIAQLDTEEGGAGEARIITPKYMQPSVLERIIRTVIPAGGGAPGGRSGDKSFQMTSDDATGILVVRGNQATLDQIQKLSDQLDTPGAGAGEVKIFKPKYIQASALDRILRTVLPGGGGAPGTMAGRGDKGFQMAADDATGTLIVKGSASIIEQIGKLIATLDVTEPVGNITAERVPLQYGSVQSLVGVLNETVKQRANAPGMTARGGATLSIQPDEGTKSIVLAGLRSQVDQAKQIIALLDKPTVTARIQIIPLSLARADNVFNQVLAPFYRNARREPPVAVDAVSNTIITWATGNELDELKSLIQQIEESAKEGRGVPTIRIYRLDDVAVDRVSGALQQMFSKQQDVTFAADPAAKTIMVAAPPEKFERIEKVLTDIRAGAKGQSIVTQVIEVKYANVDQVAGAVKGAFAPRRMPSGEQRIEISPSAQANSVLVTGLQADVEEATRLIRQLDERIHSSSEIKTYHLGFAQSDDVAKAIQDLYAAKDPTLKVVSDSWSNTLFLTGASGNVSAIDQFIKSMDRPEPEQAVSNNIAFITLKTASARDVADRVDSMLSATGGKNLPSIDASDSGNYLIVTGQPKQIEKVRQMAEEIDKMSMQIPEIIAVRPIAKTSAQRLAEMLNVLVPQQSGTKVNLKNVDLSNTQSRDLESFLRPDLGGDGGARAASQPAPSMVTIGVDKKSNTLILRGRPKDVEEIDKAIATLTADLQDDVQFKIFALKYASPTDVATNVESLFNETTPGQPGQPQANPQGGRPPQQPGQPGQAQGQGRQGRQGRGQPQAPAAPTRRVRAIPVDQISSVVVRADPRDFEAVEGFIREVDQPSEGSNIKTFKLNYARADVVAKTLSDFFGRAGGGRRRFQMMGGQPGQMSGMSQVPFNVTYDLGTNTLFVTASKNQLRDVEGLLRTLDVPATAKVEVNVLHLTTGRADQLAPVIQNVLKEAETSMAARTGTTAQPPAVSADKSTNSIIFAGTAQQFDQVKALVERIGVTAPTGPGGVCPPRIVIIKQLKNIEPEEAKKILDKLLPGGAGPGSSVWPPKSPMRNLHDGINDLIFRLAVAQTAAARTTTRPTPSAPVNNSSTQLEAIRRILRGGGARRSAAPGTPKSVIVMPPTAPTAGARTQFAAPVTTTGPAPSGLPSIPATAAPSGPAAQAVATQPALAPLTAAKAQEIQSLASRIKCNVDVTAMAQQGAVIIEATNEDAQLVQQVLDLLDQAQPAVTRKVFPLKNAQAQDLAQVLGRIFAGQPTARGQTPITFTPETTTNSIIVSASPDRMDEIGRIITQLDAGKITPPQLEFRSFALKNARASELVPQLQKMVQQAVQARGGGQVPITLTADDRTNSIIVTAPQPYMEQVSKLIATLDAVPAFATVEMETIRLKLADANAMEKLLTSLTDPTVKRGTANELLSRLEVALAKAGERSTLNLEKPVKIIADKPSQTIILLTTADNMRILRRIVEMLDTVPLADDLKVRVFPLSLADAQEVRTTLNEIFNKEQNLLKVPGTEHAQGVPENPSGRAIAFPVVLAADRASNTIVAAGQETSLALMEVLIGQLDREVPGLVYPIKTIGLKNGSAKDLAKLIQDVLDARATRATDLNAQRAAKVAKVIVRADERMNALLVSASPDDFAMIQSLVKSLDYAPTPGAEPVVIPLVNLDATTMAEMLDKFFKAINQLKPTATETQPAFPANTPIIIPEPRSNTLVVSAGKVPLAQIRDLIKKLDLAEITKTMQVAVIPLRSADAGQLATAIMQALNPTKDQSGLKQAVILEFIKHTPEGQKILQKALKDQIYIYGDKTSNLLIIVAPADTISLVQALARDIDEVAPAMELRVFALVNADATAMKKTLDDLFTKAGGTSGAGAVTAANAPTLTTAGGQTLGGGAASAIERQSIAVTADARTNSLVVSATSTYMKLIAGMIQDLDAKAIDQLRTEVITLKNADAETVQKTVSTLVENQLKMYQDVYGKEGIAPERLLEQQVNIVADNSTRKIILQASPRYFDTVRRIVEDLDEAQTQVMIQAIIVEVDLTGRIEYGFEAVGQDLSFTKAQTAPGIGPGHDVVVGTDVGAAGSGTAGFVFSLRGEDFNLLLRALNTDGKTQVLSRPQITAMNNYEATISIGQNVPFPTGSNISPDTGATTTSINYQEVGVILKVTPHVNVEGYVILEVAPEISSISSSSVQISQGLNAPIFNKSTVETKVLVKDGETVVIGGLITRKRDHNETKVPFFGDIPILGYAFKSVVDEDTRSELIVALTPKVITSVEKFRALSEEERDLMDLLPRNIRESQLLGRLKQTFDEEGYAIPQPPPSTQPVEGELTESEGKVHLFNIQRPKPCNPQLLDSLKRTCDQ